jgi:hypothetical protein
MKRHTRSTFNDNGGFFPKVARGHGAHCWESCARAKKGQARYGKDGTYIDGHFIEQAVAERAHQEGYRG